MSQWAEIRHMVLVEGVPKREVSRRLGVDVKTVRRAVAAGTWRDRRPSPRRGRKLDPHRKTVEDWLRSEPRLTAKRIGQLLRPALGAPAAPRTLREFVREIRGELRRGEVFVHRTHLPGATTEFDFGEAWAVIGGRRRKVKFLVAALPASNAYFARAYPVERLECLLDGIVAAFTFFGGMTRRGVLDNTSLAVREVLRGPERLENRVFQAFRGALPLHADFCAPRRGNEKGSTERGVDYVRGIFFRPTPQAADFEEFNRRLLDALVADLPERRLADGRTAEQALAAEREALRPLPAHWPATCRHVPVVADKYAHVQVDRVRYSVPSEHARRPLLVKLFHDRVEIVAGEVVVARHARSFVRGFCVLDARHILRVLEHKHRAAFESTAVQQWELPEVFERLFDALAARVRKPQQEWVRVLRLTEEHALEDVAAAAELALEQGAPQVATVRALLRVAQDDIREAEPVEVTRPDLAGLVVPAADLTGYDVLGEVA